VYAVGSAVRHMAGSELVALWGWRASGHRRLTWSSAAAYARCRSNPPDPLRLILLGKTLDSSTLPEPPGIPQKSLNITRH
jgi:hypothetical protein